MHSHGNKSQALKQKSCMLFSLHACQKSGVLICMANASQRVLWNEEARKLFQELVAYMARSFVMVADG